MSSIAALAFGGVVYSDVVDDWNNAYIQAIRESGGAYSPLAPVAPGPTSRGLAMMNVGMYEAFNSITRGHEAYHSFLPCPPDASADAAMAVAAHDMLGEVYPNPTSLDIDAILARHLAAIPDGASKDAGVALGKACAAMMHDLRLNDGSTDDPPYVPGGNPGDWAPTPPAFLPPWGPGWAAVTPWCITSADQFQLPGPAGYTNMLELLSSPEYAAQYDDAKAYGDLNSTVRTPYETETALFWSNDRDGTFKPPGHLMYITQVVANDRGLAMEDKVRLYALVSLGMADAGIAAWYEKFFTDIDLWRPITAIQQGDTDGNPATVADPMWVPLADNPLVPIHTPPFPAWVSGHATFGAVHAAVMRNFFNTDDVTFTVTSDDTPGVFRTYTSFTDAAKENGRSRVLLGVHWQWDADDAYTIGTNVGNWVSLHFLRRLGDLNGDDHIDGDDLGTFIAAWGATGGEADLNKDGIVDGRDMGLLLSNWG
ncbi:MAG: phosphatase PAP2 family protein [Phycisphaerales bacterium]